MATQPRRCPGLDHEVKESNSLLIGSNLTPLHSYTFALIDSEILQASYIQDKTYSGDIAFEVYHIDTDVYAEELNFTISPLLQQMCHSPACLQMKSFPNKWTNAVMRKLTRINKCVTLLPVFRWRASQTNGPMQSWESLPGLGSTLHKISHNKSPTNLLIVVSRILEKVDLIPPAYVASWHSSMATRNFVKAEIKEFVSIAF